MIATWMARPSHRPDASASMTSSRLHGGCSAVSGIGADPPCRPGLGRVECLPLHEPDGLAQDAEHVAAGHGLARVRGQPAKGLSLPVADARLPAAVNPLGILPDACRVAMAIIVKPLCHAGLPPSPSAAWQRRPVAASGAGRCPRRAAARPAA